MTDLAYQMWYKMGPEGDKEDPDTDVKKIVSKYCDCDVCMSEEPGICKDCVERAFQGGGGLRRLENRLDKKS